jgi:hypothetical protein
MEIVSIFDIASPKMGASHYEGDQCDVFTQLLRDWNDRNFLSDFFLNNISDLNEYWGMNVSDAVQYVLDEVNDFEEELLAIQAQESGYENFDMDRLFKNYHESEFMIRKKGENFRKAKPAFDKPMLRLYAIKLEDGYVITGGCIKLTHKLNEQTKKSVENQLNKTQDYIRVNKIVSLSN